MSDVTVIGTGRMGSALVEVLAGSGAQVTVWNRTTIKAEALFGGRVHLAESVIDALMTSPLTIMSVADHQVARTLVEDADADLDGRVVASTSFVTPDQGHAFATAVNRAGGIYLDLEISARPNEVRAGAGVVLISGDRTAFDAHRDRFERIGRVTYVNSAPAAAYISGMAVQLAYLPLAVGLLQGWRIAESQELSPEWFRDAVNDLYPFHIKALLDRISAQPDASARDVEAPVTAMAAWAAEYGAALDEMGIDAGMFDALHRLFASASEAGHGDADWTSIAQHVITR